MSSPTAISSLPDAAKPRLPASGTKPETLAEKPSTEKATVLKPDTELTIKNVECVRLDARRKDVFDFSTFTGDGDRYTTSVVNGVFTSSPYGPDGAVDISKR